eukprot:CAMPEP_0183817870 /NCGR_PEP_ID=MMETSP0803_2-20130417/61180_1 /TAXON_ID=195967 /ORGANISM="Crustomastix stigmata, Strain CCMP3273" /LENGTH=58 /DNA_ID=CAMNT_0026062755 /DNA_START=87 /DNA_END=260 /DNA_ORIENTATION=+
MAPACSACHTSRGACDAIDLYASSSPPRGLTTTTFPASTDKGPSSPCCSPAPASSPGS